MISPGRLFALVAQNIRRSRRQFVLSTFGIVVGIAAFSFFLALGLGVRRVVLGKIFHIDRIEVVPSRANLGAGPGMLGLMGGPRLDDAFVSALQAQPGVAAVFPKMRMRFPALAWGGHSIIGHDVHIDLSGFVDGMNPSLISGTEDVGAGLEFRDWEAGGHAGEPTCYSDNECPAPLSCAWDVNPGGRHPCEHPVPVLVSKYLVELYNGSIAPAHDLPRVGSFLANRFLGLTFTVELGKSLFGDAQEGPVGAHRRLQLVGISDKAIPLGITIPLGYVKRWNERFLGKDADKQYSSVVVKVADRSRLTALALWVKAHGFDIADSGAEQVGLFITIVTALLGFISAVIVGIAAVNIAHTFFVQITERRREIGVLRAVGASRSDVRRIVFGEAGLIGAVGGAMGLGLAFLASLGVDFVSRRFLPDFPFKPETYFHFTPALCGGAIAFAIAFCLLGAYLPARQAAAMEPAAALAAL